MTKFYEWKTNELPGVRYGKMGAGSTGEKWHDYKRAIGGTLVVLELLSVLTVVVGPQTHSSGKLE